MAVVVDRENMPLSTLQTRILTQAPGVTGTLGSIFIVASFRVWDVRNPMSPVEVAAAALLSSSVSRIAFNAVQNICWVSAAGPTAGSIGLGPQLSAFDVSDSSLPVLSGSVDLASATINTIQDVSVSGDLVALAVTDFGSVNLRQQLVLVDGADPTAPVQLAEYDTLTFGTPQGNPVVVHSNATTAFVLGAGRNLSPVRPLILAAYDISNPLAVTQQGTLSYGTPVSGGVALMTIDPAATLAFSVVGGEVGVSAPRLRIADISDPMSLAALSNVAFGAVTEVPTAVFIHSTTLYVTSGIGTATSKLFIFDVSDPTTPVLSSTVTFIEPTAADGLAAIFVDDNFVYLLTGVVPSATTLLIRTLAGAAAGSAVVTGVSSSLAITGP